MRLTALEWAALALVEAGALYSPVELTRTIILYVALWPEVRPPMPFAVEVVVIWLTWGMLALVPVYLIRRRP